MRHLALLSLLLSVTLAAPTLAEGVSADAVFEQLKSLAGTWTGDMAGEGEEAEAEAAAGMTATHVITVSANGTVVQETMGPDTPFEMINMYHLDGDELLMTHYCSGGNQPLLRLNREKSSADRLVFDYAGGTNHDPVTDQHIHSAEIELTSKDSIVSAWQGYAGGEAQGSMTFRLARTE